MGLQKCAVRYRPHHCGLLRPVRIKIQFEKFFTVRRRPFESRLATFTAILYPTAFPMIQVEPNNLVHHLGCGRKRGHQQTDRRCSHCKVISTSARNRRKSGADVVATARSSAYAHWASCRKSKPPRFLGMIASSSQRKMGSSAIANKKDARKTALPHAPGHDEFPPVFLQNSTCNTIAANHSQEPADELWQLCLLEYTENPGMIDAGHAAAKTVNKISDSCGANVTYAKGSRFNLEGVVRHLPGRDASRRWMNTSHGVQPKASTNCRGKHLAITITQSQLAQGLQ